MDRYIIREHEFIDNIQIIKSRANQVPIWAVVKGNSYGLGLEHTVPLFLSQGIRRFCVSELSEVQTIRPIAGEQVQILMLQPTTEQDTLEHLIDADAICTISSWEDAVALNHAALALGRQAKAHLKIDTGMGRYGFSEPELTQIAKIYQYLEEISILGTYTHFCSSYDKKQTRQQYNRFLAMLKNLRSIGCDPGECHCCNSAAFFLYPEMHMDAVRIGSGWLGRMTIHGDYGLHKIGFCESQIEELHFLREGMSTGYGCAWKANRPTKLAILPIGWYHGFCTQHNSCCSQFRSCLARCLCLVASFLRHQRCWVKVNGKNCPVCGRVGMLHTAVDVTDIPCQIGDPVILEINPILQKGLNTVIQ